MTVADFKDSVAAYLNRQASSLVTEGSAQDLILIAMNDARRAAQRAHDFELCRTDQAYLSTSSSGANWMTGCKTTPGGTTPILMKRIDEVWNCNTTVAPYDRTTRIDFSYSGRFRRELASSYDRTVVITPTIAQIFAYATGQTLYVTATPTAANFKLVGIQFLDDLAGGSSPDIFLTYFTDWLKFATLANLNIYLKDSERFSVDQSVVNNLWQSVKTLDGDIANMGESTNLD